MSSPGRKIARQSKRSTPEGREQLKQEQAEKQASQPPLSLPGQKQSMSSGYVPPMQVRQRRAGNS